jgi:hypothetical protein
MTNKIKVTSASTYDELRAKWQRGHALEMKAYIRTKRIRQARGSETIATLKVWYASTGDVAFSAAIRAAQKHEFNRQNSSTLKRVRDLSRGYNEEVSLAMMTRLVRSGRSIRNAAAETAVAYIVPGNSFDAVVTRLRRAYRKLPRSQQNSPRDSGKERK